MQGVYDSLLEVYTLLEVCEKMFHRSIGELLSTYTNVLMVR